MSQPLWQPRTDLAARLLGVGFFIGGSSLIGYQASVIFDAVAAHAKSVTYFTAAIALGGMAAGLGVYWMIRGLAGYAAIRALQSDPRRLRLFFIIALVVIVAATAGLNLWLASLGYDQ